MQQSGQFIQDDFFDSTGGLNLSDSAFKVKPTQATGGANYTYTQTGGIQKRRGHSLINSSPDTELKSLGLGLNNSATGIKTLVRAAGTRLQAVDTSVPSFTNLSEDTVSAGTTFLSSSSTVPVSFSQFNTPTANILWLIGSGSTAIWGNYSTTKVTQNGSDAPEGSISVVAGGSGGVFTTTGTYRYAVALHKASTGALSNASFSEQVTISATTQKATITLTSITAFDTTKYDQFYIYRSAQAGVDGFTTGDLIAQIPSTDTSYIDDGDFIADAVNVPRPDNTILDNSLPPAGVPVGLTVFKRRLVLAIESTIYFSDINKPESWPTANTLTIPSGGPITGLAIISYTSTNSNSIDEILVIFKEREIWVVQGTSITDYVLKFIDFTGCPSQPLIVAANGFLSWIDYRGVYLWDGTGKPVYCSRPIEPVFGVDGDLDKTTLTSGIGQFYRKENMIVWFLGHKIYGSQKFALKMDLRLTLPGIEQTLIGRILDGVFIYDNCDLPIYAVLSYLPSSTSSEVLLLGDDAGFLYQGFLLTNDADEAIDFTYQTRYMEQNNPNMNKRYNYVIVWVEEIGDWNLTLDWWTDYNTDPNRKSTRALPISEALTSATALWDIAFWDTAFWDSYNAKLRPLWFMLSSDEFNNNEGKCIKLQFRQEGVDEPVTISGFSLLYSMKGAAK